MTPFYLAGTDVKTVKNAFGALPIQRRTTADAVKILQRALDGGMTFFDTARSYSDSEEKIGLAFKGIRRDAYYLATKTPSTTPEGIRRDIETSLKNLGTDYVDIYQLHNAKACYAPGDGTGVYECMQDLKKEGKIRYISMTCHRIDVAEKAVLSGLYATMQYPFSYLASQKEHDLVGLCKKSGVGFIAMKGMAGGLITDATLASAFMNEFDNVLPIWGIQTEKELDEWLALERAPVRMKEEYMRIIEGERKSLSSSFCRACGYCMPCPQGIKINQAARMSLMLRRAPTKAWLTEEWQAEMNKIQSCTGCNSCASKCPYGLDTPKLLKENFEDYFAVLRGERQA